MRSSKDAGALLAATTTARVSDGIIIRARHAVHKSSVSYERNNYAGIINHAAPELNPFYFSLGAKMKVRTLFTLTGAPLKAAVLKPHLRAASTAALRSAIWPLTATASTTSPCSEMVISTSTAPMAFIFLALSG